MTFRTVLLLGCAVFAAMAMTYLRRQKSFRTSLHRKYLLSLACVVVIIVCVLEAIGEFVPSLDLKTILLGSSALLVAILGFAAQPAIMDIMCGLLISIHRPFEIGDRIGVEGQEPGIVEDITLRHTVLRLYDDLRIIIPNGQLNSKTVTNFSYGMPDRRGVHLRFSVSYDTDVTKAMDVIRDCVAASPYTLGIVTNGIKEDTGPVYFLEYGDSALLLRTTIWISRDTNTQKAVTDINVRVLEAFRRHGIEIPYAYVNVVEFEGSKNAPAAEVAKSTAPVLRYYRTDDVQIEPAETGLQEAIDTADAFARRQNLSPRASMQLQLLTEESLGLFQRIMAHTHRDFWIEGSGIVYRIHLRASVHVDSLESYQRLIEISSSGRNEAVNNINAKIVEAVLIGRNKLLKRSKGSKEGYNWKLSDTELDEHDIGKSILGKLASDVRINVQEHWVELIVVKKM